MVDNDQILSYLEESVRQHRGKFKEHYKRKASKQIRERKKRGLIANVAYCRYDLVRKAIDKGGFSISDNEDLTDAFLIWTDNFLPLDRMLTLKPYQRVNHFPGMIEICRKDLLAKNYRRMNRLEPIAYNFMPKTWVLPQEHGTFMTHLTRMNTAKGTKASYILKPSNGAMGHGIRIFRNGDRIPADPISGTTCVVQEYLDEPLLIDGYKCDLRVYVLITSCDPLRIYVYKDGLVRLGAEKYVDPTKPEGASVFMHLTNYAVNKRHAQYNRSSNEMSGSKRSFSFLDHYLQKTLHVNPRQVWHDIRNLIVKTMAIASPHLLHAYRMCRRSSINKVVSGKLPPTTTRHQYSQSGKLNLPGMRLPTKSDHAENLSCKDRPSKHRLTDTTSNVAAPRSQPTKEESTSKSMQGQASCGYHHPVPFVQSSYFEILGFDILLDNDLKPWLIEVNRSPSFNGDQDLDQRVKCGLLSDTLRLLNIRPTDKQQTELEQRLTSVNRLYVPPAPPKQRKASEALTKSNAGHLRKKSSHSFSGYSSRKLPLNWHSASIDHRSLCCDRRFLLLLSPTWNTRTLGSWHCLPDLLKRNPTFQKLRVLSCTQLSCIFFLILSACT